MLHNIIVVGASDKVDALISKFRNKEGVKETSRPADQLLSLGYREFYFTLNSNTFVIRHLSTKKNG